MTISHIGTTATYANPAGVAVGDLQLSLTVNVNNSTLPTLATGFTNLATGVGNGSTSAWRLAYRIYDGSGTHPTVTNANSIFNAFYRASSGSIFVGANSSQTGNGTTVTHPALTLQNAVSWVMTTLITKNANTTAQLGAVPSGMTSRLLVTRQRGSDTNDEVSSFASRNVTITSSIWITNSVEIYEFPPVNLTGAQDTEATTQVGTIVVEPFIRAVTGAQTTSSAVNASDIDPAVKLTGSQNTLAATQSATASPGAPAGTFSAVQTLSKAINTANAYVSVKQTGAQTLSAAANASAINIPSYIVNVTGSQILPNPNHVSSVVIPSGLRRIMLGKQTDGSYGLRISEPGYDAGSNPVDQERLYFNSDWGSMMQVHQAGNFLHRAGPSDKELIITTTINYPTLGAGYIPFVEFFMRATQLYGGYEPYMNLGEMHSRTAMPASFLHYYHGDGGNVEFIPWVRTIISASQIQVQSYEPGTGYWPSQFRIYYCIYKRKAN